MLSRGLKIIVSLNVLLLTGFVWPAESIAAVSDLDRAPLLNIQRVEVLPGTPTVRGVFSVRLRTRIQQVWHNFKNSKFYAALLTVTLGPFGVHRLYLGTDAKVPVIYTLTLGGGLGILPLLDLIAILSAPSLEKFENNSRVIMWAH